MTTFEATNSAISELGALKFFPRDVRARLTLVRLVQDMAFSDDQTKWLIRRALQLYDSWEGPKELRALYCSRWRPRDGVEAQSSVYPEGFPPERKPEPKILINPHGISADPELERAVRELARAKDMNRRAK